MFCPRQPLVLFFSALSGWRGCTGHGLRRGISAHCADAGSINFYNVPGNTLLKEDGVTALDNGFVFEFGTFEAGFTPTGTTSPTGSTTGSLLPVPKLPPSTVGTLPSPISTSSGILQLSGQSDQGLFLLMSSPPEEPAHLWVYNHFLSASLMAASGPCDQLQHRPESCQRLAPAQPLLGGAAGGNTLFPML